MKILHILDHYKPHFSGYVFRTSYILKYQKEFDLEPVCITSPKQGIDNTDLQEIDNVRIYRTPQTGFENMPFIKEARLMNALQKRIEEVISKENPDIIHAHSPSLNGIPAVRAGKKHGIPVVYEVRALWEDAAVDHATFKEGSLKYRTSRLVETKLMKRVDALFTICNGLKNEIVSRGIPDDKVTVIPNCVDLEFFTPEKYDEEIAEQFGLKDKFVFGYIGSFYHYEGIDILLESYSKTLEKQRDSRLLLVGDGPEKVALNEKADKMGLIEHVIFTGKILHEQIKKYYSVIDVLIYPRKKMKLTDLVTPLKPLEAMAMGKVVVGSDVGGIKDLITHKQNGYLFKAGNVDNLITLLNRLNQYNRHFNQIKKAAQETIRRKYTCYSAVERYIPVYTRLIKNQI